MFFRDDIDNHGINGGGGVAKFAAVSCFVNNGPNAHNAHNAHKWPGGPFYKKSFQRVSFYTFQYAPDHKCQAPDFLKHSIFTNVQRKGSR